MDKFGSAAASGTLDEPTRVEALGIAHKLAGSLGMYGYQQGTEVASQMEHILKSPTPRDVAHPPLPRRRSPQISRGRASSYFVCRTAHPARSIAAAKPSYSTGSLFPSVNIFVVDPRIDHSKHRSLPILRHRHQHIALIRHHRLRRPDTRIVQISFK